MNKDIAHAIYPKYEVVEYAETKVVTTYVDIGDYYVPVKLRFSLEEDAWKQLQEEAEAIKKYYKLPEDLQTLSAFLAMKLLIEKDKKMNQTTEMQIRLNAFKIASEITKDADKMFELANAITIYVLEGELPHQKDKKE